MSDTQIPGGYILLSRKLLESDIWQKPPLYLKIWIYLLLKAQHQDYKGLKRGQVWVSMPELQEAMAYKIGYRVEKPSIKQIRQALDYLRNPSHEILANNPVNGTTKGTTKGAMMVTTKGTHGLLVNIVNYDIYQDPRNYEGHNEGHVEGTAKGATEELRGARQGHNINKNDKNDNNDLDIYSQNIGQVDPVPYQAIVDSYNKICLSLPKAIKLTDKRKRAIRARWKEYGDIQVFRTVFTKVEASDFLTGRSGKWRAPGFDWLMEPGNMVKILEGSYDNTKSVQKLERSAGPRWDLYISAEGS